MPIASSTARAAAMRAALPCLLVLAALLLGACGETESCTGSTLEVCGTYTDQFGDLHSVTQDSWKSFYDSSTGFSFVHHVLVINNSSDFLIAQNDENNAFSAGLYSRFSWTTYNGDLYYCQNPYAAATAQEAENATAPGRTNPASGGCDQFSWTNLTP